MIFKFLVIFSVFSFALGRHVNFYRKDYTYFDEFDAYYKLHWDSNGVSWNTAFFACDQEGAKLFYPKMAEEWTVVKNLSEVKSLELNITEIFVGIQNEGIDEFITVDGHSTPSPLVNDKQLSGGNLCTTMDIETGVVRVDICKDDKSTPKPFVCKKVEDVSCPTIDRDYQYVKETKKCYKFNNRKQTWHEALHTCAMEGGILAVVESAMEAEILKERIHDGGNSEWYYVGFRKVSPSFDYYTIKGQKLQDAYKKFYDDDNNDCGLVYSWNNGLYTKSSQCDTMLKFICEMTL